MSGPASRFFGTSGENSTRSPSPVSVGRSYWSGVMPVSAIDPITIFRSCAKALVGLEVLLDFHPGDGHGDQPDQRDRARAPAQVVADGAGVVVPAQEQEGVPVIVPEGSPGLASIIAS